MDKLYRIFYKLGIFGWRQMFSTEPIFYGKKIDLKSEEFKDVKYIEYVKTEDAKLTAKDIEEIESLIEDAKASDPDYGIHKWVAAEFNRKKYGNNA